MIVHLKWHKLCCAPLIHSPKWCAKPVKWGKMVFKWEEVANTLPAGIMLIGEYSHSFDDKSRISLPAKFRKEMGTEVVIAPGIDNCLFVFTLQGWKEFTDRVSRPDSSSVLQADNRNFNRVVIGRAVEVEVDGMGRILVPENLRTYASLTGKATILGVLNRVEIWNAESWEKYRDEFSKKADVMAEKLGSAGII